MTCGIIAATLRAWGLPYPAIETATPRNAMYRQLQVDIATFHRAHANQQPLPALVLYSYRVQNGDDLFSLAARFNVGIQSLVSINRLSTPDDIEDREEIVIPNIPGIYVASYPSADFELFVAAMSQSESKAMGPFFVFLPARTEFRLLPGAKFTPTQTSFFLGVLYRFPLPSGVVTSQFGLRSDPFSDSVRFHHGIDIAAREGTNVHASRAGLVVYAGRNEILGIHCVVAHDGGYQSLYGHLSELTVELNDRVNSGAIIGFVGSTGRSTGPHLHFEIRSADEARNPASFLTMPGSDE